ncbi:MAG: choice-of-anchor J domain-containing protein [Bacteroidales bacterium]|nr:choice-of-anchor J domain-containing protein [Bacteroidales bacterium]
MKRFAFSSLALLALLMQAPAQVLFHDDFQDATDRFSVGQVKESWTLYNDNNTPASSPDDLSHFTQAWNVWVDKDGSRQAAAVSFFTQANAVADRWMVTPAINLASAKNPVLVFRAKRVDTEYRDGFEVKISVSGKEKESFTASLQTVAVAPSSWTYYTIDLSEYAGKEVYIAFIQNSSGKYMVCVDDVAVLETEPVAALVTEMAASPSVTLQGIPQNIIFKAALLNTGSDPIVSYTLCRQADGGEVVREIFSDVKIEPYKTLNITTSTLINTEGNHTFSIWVEKINGKNIASDTTSTMFYSVKESSLPRKNLLLEMFSSGMCSNCAPLNSWMHPIFIEQKANVPDNSGHFSVVKYQVDIPSVGDPTVTEHSLARAEHYNVNAAPTVYMNGRVFRPTDTTIGHRLRDSIARFAQVTIPTGISASLEREDGTFRIHAKVTNYLPDMNDYNLVICLIEDSIHLMSTLHNGEKDLYNVVRQMVPGITGTPISIETTGGVVEKDFEYTFDKSSPEIYSSYENMAAVIFLQNSKNNQVSQSFYLKPGHSAANDARPAAGRTLSLYPNPAGEHCSVVFDAVKGGKATLRIFNAQGKTVRTENILLQAGKNLFELETASLVSGLYFVQVENEQGVFTHKLMKR